MTRVAALAVLAACVTSPSRLDPPAANARELFAIDVPDDRALAGEAAEAVALGERERLERALDAIDPGELYEHIAISQRALADRAHSPADLLRIGDELFAYEFRPENGLGNALSPDVGAGPRAAPNLRRVHAGEFGGPDALACADCHSVGGDDGAGAITQNTFFRSDGDHTLGADVRNPPALLGVGPIEALAAEMTAELAGEREAARARAPTEVALIAKGISFGTLAVRADGTFETSRVAGVAPDLVVRPFGWKGQRAHLRDFVREEFRQHLGLVALSDEYAARDGLVARELGDGPWYDLDRDGVTTELDDGMLSTMVAYLAQLEVPIVVPPRDPELAVRFVRGLSVFSRAGCASCHVPSMILLHPRVVTAPDEPGHPLDAPIAIDVAHDGRTPKLAPAAMGYRVALFSDLRRHDLGGDLAAPADQASEGGAIGAREWLTRPLWGLADSAPYLHDGRATTIEDAIRAHGGEAAASHDAFLALDPQARADLLVLLSSLTRTSRVVTP